jgi:hypothetical protein
VCDAIDAACPLIEYLDDEVLNKYFIPQMLTFLDFKSHTTTEITEIFSENFGQIVFNLSKRKKHMPFKMELLNFWRDMLAHEDSSIKFLAIYYLPCMLMLFKDVQEECGVDFAVIYQQLLSEEGKVRRKTAMSLHEVFVMFKETDEDMSPFKECFLDLLGDDTSKLIKTVNKHLTTYLFNFFNQLDLAVKSPKSDDDKKESETTFQQIEVLKKPNCKKRQQTLMISQVKDECSDDSKSNRRPNVFITDENSPELIYTDLLDSLLPFI